ncbi:hypothetical protein NPIL_242311 [Nephila pilipes]|uniref:Uncharacterized protein n=1 Tax=Nephila pilipes TaxID=299642 RepID=A0A8X6QTL7_NEPPI|nr:hypothetical protein NPIL_242311 [Nephila pilipes]
MNLKTNFLSSTSVSNKNINKIQSNGSKKYQQSNLDQPRSRLRDLLPSGHITGWFLWSPLGQRVTLTAILLWTHSLSHYPSFVADEEGLSCFSPSAIGSGLVANGCPYHLSIVIIKA